MPAGLALPKRLREGAAGRKPGLIDYLDVIKSYGFSYIELTLIKSLSDIGIDFL